MCAHHPACLAPCTPSIAPQTRVAPNARPVTVEEQHVCHSGPAISISLHPAQSFQSLKYYGLTVDQMTLVNEYAERLRSEGASRCRGTGSHVLRDVHILHLGPSCAQSHHPRAPCCWPVGCCCYVGTCCKSKRGQVRCCCCVAVVVVVVCPPPLLAYCSPPRLGGPVPLRQRHLWAHAGVSTGWR